jgi:hypothetical protein
MGDTEGNGSVMSFLFVTQSVSIEIDVISK